MPIVRILERIETPRLIVPACLFVQYNQETDRFFLVDQAGFVLPQADFEALARELALTYAQFANDIPVWNEEREKEINPPTTEPRPGFVYLLHSSSGLYKIGESVDPERRLKTIRHKKPNEQIDIVYTFPADEPWNAEQRLHSHFGDKRQRNPYSEWFNLDSTDVDYIKSIARFEGGQFHILNQVERLFNNPIEVRL